MPIHSALALPLCTNGVPFPTVKEEKEKRERNGREAEKNEKHKSTTQTATPRCTSTICPFLLIQEAMDAEKYLLSNGSSAKSISMRGALGNAKRMGVRHSGFPSHH